MHRSGRILFTAVIGLLLAGCEAADRCEPQDHTVCMQGKVYWVDACGVLEDLIEACDCGCNEDYTDCEEPCDCVPQCEDRECGPNMCGGNCPPGCDTGEQCNQVTGLCEAECVPDCQGKCCGSDGCGGDCPDNCSSTGQSCNQANCRCEGTCEPDCQGRECGPDGCGAACPPGCGYDETCDLRTGLCESVCVPDCAGKECGPDGCDGECRPGCQAGDVCTPDGRCIEYVCGSMPPTVSGSLQTSVAPVNFDQASVNLIHKRDIDEYEDGCIVQIDIDMQQGTGCQLSLTASGRYSHDLGLLIQSVEFSADSFCRNFPDSTEGTYVSNGGMILAEVVPASLEVPGYNQAEVCFLGDFIIKLDGVLRRVTDDEELIVGPSQLTVRGDTYSTGHTEYSCPCVPDCAGKDCGPDGCGTDCGTCPGEPVYCSDQGLCLDDCEGRECGYSPIHSFLCGSCDVLQSCISGQCECDYAECVQQCCASGEICHQGDCCLPDCTNRVCGGDGCGGSCGSCYGATEYCNSAGQCIDDCAGRDCGPSPTQGYDCGSCTGATVYCSSAGHCIDDCAGRECGSSPVMGYDCGTCTGNYEYCISGQCRCQYEDCGSLCCSPGQVCHLGACCQPQCGGAECGPDGCGGTCGTCSGSEPVCDGDTCVECLVDADCPDPSVFHCQDKICHLVCDEDQYEPNNTSAEAVDITIPFTDSMTLCGYHDNDWFRVNLNEQATYIIDLVFTHADGDVDLYLVDSSNQSVVTALSTTDNEHIEYTVPAGEGGTYYVRVYLFSRYTQTYQMVISQ